RHKVLGRLRSLALRFLRSPGPTQEYRGWRLAARGCRLRARSRRVACCKQRAGRSKVPVSGRAPPWSGARKVVQWIELTEVAGPVAGVAGGPSRPGEDEKRVRFAILRDGNELKHVAACRPFFPELVPAAAPECDAPS